MGEFFTRADWRPSKRRKYLKRINPYAGCKTAPAAFLEAGKKVQFGSGVHRICRSLKRNGEPCGNVALKGLPVCGCHGGFTICAKRGKLNPTGKGAAIRAARVAAKEDRTPPPPPDLLSLKPYQQANQWTRMRMIRAWNTPAWPSLIRQIQRATVP